MKFIKLNTPPNTQLKNLGWDWAIGQDTLPYITNELLQVSENEAEAYYNAANTLYQMLIEAGQYVIDNDKFEALGIPQNLVEAIKYTWNNDDHLHLYGRFDFAGGLENKPIKLIEFNADTATCIPETAIIQWASLKTNNLDDQSQFNTLYESLIEQFGLLKTLNHNLLPTLLISTLRDFPEDSSNAMVLGEAAKEAGFDVVYAYIDEVEFSETEGVFTRINDIDFLKYDFWFKLIPWESIAWSEPDLANILTKMILNNKIKIINPPYTLLFQSKGILKILWQLFPNHPLLLETDTKPLTNKKSVQKVLFGREGANVRILDQNGNVETEIEGEYEDQKSVYQAFTDFNQDQSGNYYQAGVFFVGEGAGLGFRKGGKIIDNTAQFVGHIVG